MSKRNPSLQTIGFLRAYFWANQNKEAFAIWRHQSEDAPATLWIKELPVPTLSRALDGAEGSVGMFWAYILCITASFAPVVLTFLFS